MRGPKSDAPDEVRRLAENGLSAREIAASLKISRQRVYQVCSRYGIQPGLPKIPPRRGVIICKPRLITGGIQQFTNARMTGTVSELLVAADLIARGWHVYLPVIKQRGFDVIVTQGRLVLTIEVRSASKNTKGTLTWTKRPTDCSDYYALVVTGDPVKYQPDLPAVPLTRAL
jgi:hypothetical protein